MDEFVSEDDALLPVSEQNPDIDDHIKWFFRELYRRLFKRKSTEEILSSHKN